MRTIFILFISIYLNGYTIFAQNSLEYLLSEIEKNNTSLIASKLRVEADKIGNRTGIYLSNPELEFNYLFGNPNVIGTRTDLSVRQTFDFPSAYAHKSRIADSRNTQSDLEYQNQLKTLLLQARMLCIDLIHANALKKELDRRLLHSQNIASSFKFKLDLGEAGILEFNKAQLNLLNVEKSVESNEINRKYLLSELAVLNGGVDVTLIDTIYLSDVITDDFEQWYLLAEQNNPALSWLKREIEILQIQEKLNLAMSLPKISAGYMSEKTTGQQFQGISAGLSIPLWENKNSVRYAKAQVIALQSRESDSRLVFYNLLKINHTKANSLQKSVTDYRHSLKSFDNSVLLKRALDKGEISLTDYFFEISLYYESINKLLDSERELNQAVAVLNQYSR